jgi:hypothetical protein
MHLRHRRAVAALLVSAALAVPGGALAADPAPPQSPPADTGKGPAMGPSKEAAVDSQNFKVSRDEAISIAVRMFNIPKELGEPNVGASESKDGAMWQLEYHTPAKQAMQVNISVGIDAQTGAVLNYNRSAAEAGKDPAPLSYTRAQALAKASFWLDMLAPALKPSLRAIENPMSYGYYGTDATYNFQWQRIAEGYPVRNDSVNIAIDARTGQLASFNRGRGSAQSFKLPATLLDKAKAEAAYRSQIQLQLQYQYYQKPGTDTGEWKLVYRPNTSSYPMMNQDGKLIDYSGQPLNVAAMSEMKLVPAADKPYQAPAKSLSKEEALQLAKAAAGRTDEPNNASYNEQGAEQKSRIWNFNWQAQDEKGGIYTNVGVDVDRGLIVNYNSYGPQQPLKEGEQPKFTEAQARETAMQFIRSYRPDLAGKLMIMPSVESSNPAMKAKLAYQQMYYVSFVMMKNGLQVADRQMSVNVDAMTGTVRSFWANDLDSKQEFPAVTGVIKPEAAMDAFLASEGLEAFWTQFWQPMPMVKDVQSSEPQLVWGPGAALNVVAIDAKTGAPLDYQGRDLLQQGKRPTDIDGNPAEREIELLWVRGILDLKDGKFNPGQTATAGELARWLVMARGMQPYMSYDFRGNFAGSAAPAAAKLESAADSAYFGAALQNGVILPEDFTADSDPAAPVSRELFALWVARAMGYGAVAKMPNHIAMPFADQAKIGAKYANAVALLNGLGVVKGDQQTNFEPQRQVTRGEAAMFLFTVASEPRR